MRAAQEPSHDRWAGVMARGSPRSGPCKGAGRRPSGNVGVRSRFRGGPVLRPVAYVVYLQSID
eukprot:2139760-Amphidinium_carterae.1